MIPQRVPEPDRTWLTVAAYNVGFGHLEDARILAQAFGKNPDSWAEVRARLPLLAQERWYARARRGYARGWEPVQYVDRIQRYLRLLEWQPGEAVSRSATVTQDRKSTRLNSSHSQISYAVFCLKKKTQSPLFPLIVPIPVAISTALATPPRSDSAPPARRVSLALGVRQRDIGSGHCVARQHPQ